MFYVKSVKPINKIVIKFFGSNRNADILSAMNTLGVQIRLTVHAYTAPCDVCQQDAGVPLVEYILYG